MNNLEHPIEIKIQCFGAFRQFGEYILLDVAQNTKVKDLKGVLIAKIREIDPSFNQFHLVDKSRFADEIEILDESLHLENGMKITIIPPISGG